jgi:hypothetical protein
MLAEGDGEGAKVVLRALGDVTGLVQERRAMGDTRERDAKTESDEGDSKLPNVTSIDKARLRGPKDGKKTGR